MTRIPSNRRTPGHRAPLSERTPVLAMAVLLVGLWLGGGVTEDPTSIDELLELLALPVLVLALHALTGAGSLARSSKAALVVVGLIALVPLTQLLPVPMATWEGPPARVALARDLASAGITLASPRWSLAWQQTERALWTLLPAFALFVGALSLDGVGRRRALQLVLALVLSNAMFAFFQVGLPPESPLRLYPDNGLSFGGLLINTNHQATALIIGMALAVGLAVDAHARSARGLAKPHTRWWYAGAALFCLLAVPLSTSRAGVVIALVAAVAVLAATGLLKLARFGRSKRATAYTLAGVVVAGIGIASAWRWMQVDEAEEQRHTFARAALDMAHANAPLGSGVGSLVPVFEQSAPPDLWLPYYINHVHNEYVQWWLTGGYLGLVVLVLALALVLWVGAALLRPGRRRDPLGCACWVAVCAVLAHSYVDYPLRTLTLMGTTALLAGIAVAVAGRPREIRAHRQPDAAAQPA